MDSNKLMELAEFLESVMDDSEITEAGGADVTLSLEEVEWFLDQIYFALRHPGDL